MYIVCLVFVKSFEGQLQWHDKSSDYHAKHHKHLTHKIITRLNEASTWPLTAQCSSSDTSSGRCKSQTNYHKAQIGTFSTTSIYSRISMEYKSLLFLKYVTAGALTVRYATRKKTEAHLFCRTSNKWLPVISLKLEKAKYLFTRIVQPMFVSTTPYYSLRYVGFAAWPHRTSSTNLLWTIWWSDEVFLSNVPEPPFASW
jgi:hypothetical protein